MEKRLELREKREDCVPDAAADLEELGWGFLCGNTGNLQLFRQPFEKLLVDIVTILEKVVRVLFVKHIPVLPCFSFKLFLETLIDDLGVARQNALSLLLGLLVPVKEANLLRRHSCGS